MDRAKPHLIVGLGNPGAEYEKTRHNAGFMVVDEISRYYDVSMNTKKFDAAFGRGMVEGNSVILLKPLSYMNRSGTPVHRFIEYFNLSKKDMLVVYDDLDLEFGRIQIKEKGGHGGHKGLKSIMEVLGEDEFVRLRFGIGRSENGADVVDHVLGKFTFEETQTLSRIIPTARDALVTVLCKGAKHGMNAFNNKRISISG